MAKADGRDSPGEGGMRAEALLYKLGHELLGRTVLTEEMGEYPGGEAVVVELLPHRKAPEILFTVKHPTFGECGVFDWEEVHLCPEKPS